jgi:hypothetical protein
MEGHRGSWETRGGDETVIDCRMRLQEQQQPPWGHEKAEEGRKVCSEERVILGRGGLLAELGQGRQGEEGRRAKDDRRVEITKERERAPVAHAYNASYLEDEIRRIMVRGQPRQIVHETPISKGTRKMDWRCGLSSRAPAL